jgi:hypothetical protein
MGERAMQYEHQALGSEKARADAWKLLEQIKTTLDENVRRELARRGFRLAQLAVQLESEAQANRMPMSDVIDRE